ncbi:P2X purinoceptor 7-like [Asterias rubens]|uniref:P2X purinoceptor 7-like n=1 Tax=Asterias rubens TaxID=7604 RepID=UPI001454FE3E|nr:P2X purinoceptor 7-like [Asterias rubens]
MGTCEGREISVDSDGSSEGSESTSGGSGDSDDVEPDDEDEVVRGAEPYRFEPLARPRQQQGDAAAADDADPDEEQDGNDQAANNERLNNTDWCSCGKCVVMEFVHNCICCKEIAAIQEKIVHTGVDTEGFRCFTDHPWYSATCLNPGTLETAYYAYRQQYGARAVEGDLPRKYRHVSYRQVIGWCNGYLGRHNRVPLPACIMEITRTTFPDEGGNYEGFRFPDLDDM